MKTVSAKPPHMNVGNRAVRDTVVPLLVTALLVIGGFTGTFLYHLEHLQNTTRALTPEVFNQSFAYNEKEYRVRKNGIVIDLSSNTEVQNPYVQHRVLTLAHFYNVTQEDPVFYSPTISAQRWETVLHRVEEAREQLFSAMNNTLPPYKYLEYRQVYTEFAQYPDAVYPLTFLKLVAQTSEATNAFLRKPSWHAAQRLLALQAKTRRTYENSVRNFASLVRLTFQNTADRKMQVLGNSTNLEVIYNDFLLMQENAKVLERDIRDRRRCLTIGACVPLQKKAYSPTPETTVAVQRNSNPFTKQPFLPLELITPPDTIATKGPFLISSRCWRSDKNVRYTQWPMYLFISTFRDVQTSLPMLANQNYYWDVTGSPSLTSQLRAELGITYDDQAATNVYMCNDLRFYPTITAMAFLQDRIKEAGIITPSENHLLESSLPSDTILPQLAEEYREIDSLETRERLHMVENKLVGFEFTLGKLYELMRGYTALFHYNESPILLHSMLSSRSAYSLLYLSFSKSVWRLDKYPQYLLPELAPFSGNYITWQSFIDQGGDPRKARVWDTYINENIIKDIESQQGDTSVAKLCSTIMRIAAALAWKNAASIEEPYCPSGRIIGGGQSNP